MNFPQSAPYFSNASRMLKLLFISIIIIPIDWNQPFVFSFKHIEFVRKNIRDRPRLLNFLAIEKRGLSLIFTYL